MSTSTSGATNVLKASVAHDLMKNYAPATPFSTEHPFVAAQDRSGESILFSVGKAGRLHVIFHDTKSSTGFRQVDLSGCIGEDREVSAFQVSQDRDHALTLVVAVHPAGNPDAAEIHVASPSRDGSGAFQWDEVGAAWRWVHRPIAGGPFRIAEIAMSAGGALPLCIAAVGRPMSGGVGGQREARYFQINTKVDDAGWSAREWRVPQNATNPVSTALGLMNGELGVFGLYVVGDEQQLLFIGPEDPEYPDQRSNARLDLVRKDGGSLGGAVTIAAETVKGASSSHVFVAGEFGVAVFPAARGPATLVTGKLDGHAVKKLAVRSDEATITLWPIDQADQLYTLEASVADVSAWTWPAPLSRRPDGGSHAAGTSWVATLRNWSRKTNEYFVVQTDNTVERRFQDPVSTMWQAQPIHLPASDKALEFACYTTTVTYRDLHGMPATDAAISIRASDWTRVTINGESHVLEPSRDVEVRTNGRGRLTIIQPVKGLDCVTYTLRAGGVGLPVAVNPMDVVLAKLNEVKSGKDWEKLSAPDGRSLGGGRTPAEREAAAKALQQLLKTRAAVEGGEAQPSFDISGAPEAEEPAFILDLSGAEPLLTLIDGDDVSFGLGDDLWGRVKGYAAKAAEQVGAAASWVYEGGKAVATKAGDILASAASSAWTGVKWAVGAVVEAGRKVVRFAFEVGKKVLSFVVDGVVAVVKGINWLIKEVFGVDVIDELVKFVGRLLPWDEIKVTREYFAAELQESLTALPQVVAQVAEDLRSGVEAAAGGLRSIGEEVKRMLGDNARKSVWQLLTGARATDTPDLAGDSPAAGFLEYHIEHSAAAPNTMAKPVEADVFKALLESAEQTGAHLLEALRSLASTIVGTVTGEPIGALVDSLFSVFQEAVRAVGSVVEGVFRIMAALMQTVVKILETPLEIPFFSALWQEKIGGPMNAINAFSFFMAIPVTVIYKLFTGHGPVQSLQDKKLKRPTDTQSTRTFIVAGAGAVVGLGVYVLRQTYKGVEELLTKIGLLAKGSWLKAIQIGGAVWKMHAIYQEAKEDREGVEELKKIRMWRAGIGSFGIVASAVDFLDPDAAGPAAKAVFKCLDTPLAAGIAGDVAIYHFRRGESVTGALTIVQGVVAFVDGLGTIIAPIEPKIGKACGAIGLGGTVVFSTMSFVNNKFDPCFI